MKTKVVFIHGGDTFSTQEAFVENLQSIEIDIDRMRPYRSWKDTIQKDLGENYEVFFPRMPQSDNADYELWKMWFEKVMEALGDTQVVVGHSLGAMFLLKYYSERSLERPLSALILLAPEYFGSLKKDHIPTSFDLKDDISQVTKNFKQVVFFHSEDDPVVPFENLATFQKLLPEAVLQAFKVCKHFNIESFPEIVQKIKSISI